MKLKYIFIIVLFVVIIGVIIYLNTLGNAAFVIKLNWGINLPNSDKMIYYIDSGPSFNGDGEYYTVLEYKSKNSIKKLDNVAWVNEKNTNIENKIDIILSGLKVKKENYPNFNNNYRYYYSKKEDSSEIFIINSTNDNKLYIIENIF